MKKTSYLILLHLFFVALTEGDAFSQTLVLTNRSTSRVNRLDISGNRRIYLRLTDDPEGFYSKVIIRKIDQDSLYLANPQRPTQIKAIHKNALHTIKVRKRTAHIVADMTATTFLGASILLFIVTLKESNEEETRWIIPNLIHFSGLLATIHTAGQKRKFNMNDYHIALK